MNYDEIISTALGMSDRGDDPELPSKMDGFLRIVEARANRKLGIRSQSKRAYIYTVQDRDTYCLPPDFSGMRHIALKSSEVDTGTSMTLVSPDEMVVRINSNSFEPVYTIVENSIMVWPRPGDMVIEIMYYQRILPLTTTNNSNWLSVLHPDVYLFGLMVEISAWAKDSETAKDWDGRFQTSLGEVDDEDQRDRWSGSPLAMRIE